MVAGLDKSRPPRPTSQLVPASDFFHPPSSVETTDHPNLVPRPLANGHTDAFNSGIDQVLPSETPLRPAGSSVTAENSIASAPQGNFDDIIQFLENELKSRPRSVWSHQLLDILAHRPCQYRIRPLIACCIKQNDEPEHTSADIRLEQRKEKRMNVEITLDPTAATSQWVKLPTAAEHTTDDDALSLSLIVGGDRNRGVLGCVGPYCSADPEVLEFLRGADFPKQEIGVGKTVNVGFRFKKYPRDLDTREQAFR